MTWRCPVKRPPPARQLPADGPGSFGPDGSAAARSGTGRTLASDDDPVTEPTERPVPARLETASMQDRHDPAGGQEADMAADVRTPGEDLSQSTASEATPVGGTAARPEREAVPDLPSASSARSGTEGADATLLFGTATEVRSPQAETDLLVQAAQQVPTAVGRRLAEACGVGTAELLGRLQEPDSIRDLRDSLGTEPQGSALPEWVDELAARLLLDTGAQTRDGQRTGPARLDREDLTDGRKVIEVANSRWGTCRAIDIVEQLHLSLSFASDTWSAMTLLRDAGKEAEWTLRDAAVKPARLTSAERTRLEAAQRIEHELERVRAARAEGLATVPNALEEAALTADALKSLQPSERADAGWPVDVGLPNPRSPGDIARMTAAATNLHRDVRAIANRLIAAWVAGDPADREARAG